MLAPLAPKQVYEEQVRLQKESDQKKERKKNKMIKNPRGKEKETKKRERKNKWADSTNERKENFYAKASEIKRAMFSNNQ